MADSRSLLTSIEAFCRRHSMAASTFGLKAVNDGKLAARLESGGRVSLETANAVNAYIENYAVPRAARQKRSRA